MLDILLLLSYSLLNLYLNGLKMLNATTVKVIVLLTITENSVI